MKPEETEVDYKTMKVSSTAFTHNSYIPAKYSCYGLNSSPPLEIHSVTKEAKCLALIVDDPDAPAGTWVHWLVWNIPDTHHIKEGERKGVQGTNKLPFGEFFL